MINHKIIVRVLGLLLIVESIFMFFTTLIAFIYHEPQIKYIIASSIITFSVGIVAFFFTRKADTHIGKREGYIIVSLVWVVFSIFGALPFYLSGEIPSYTDAFFETISGFTTTGSTILPNIEALSYSAHFWRSLTQWLGGMGIIVLSLAILPILGIGGMQLFVAEVPGPTPDKLHPRVMQTAQRLWGIYVLFTVSEAVLLYFAGMTVFDAICHSFTTMATGGYSTKNTSIGYFQSPYIHYIITFFMILAGVNFTLSYLALKGKFKKIIRNEEFKFYLRIIFFVTVTIASILFFKEKMGLEESLREALFQVVSIVTTTGYGTIDYLKWFPPIIIILFVLMFCGGSAGSTGGGVKIIRIMILFKNSYNELKRLIHPNAIVPVRVNTKAVEPKIVSNILAFIVIYLLIVAASTIIMSAMGYDFETSIGAVATTIGNIGPGLGKVGPVENFAHIPDFGKWFLSFLMLVGRLEVFTVIILFSRSFWRK